MSDPITIIRLDDSQIPFVFRCSCRAEQGPDVYSEKLLCTVTCYQLVTPAANTTSIRL